MQVFDANISQIVSDFLKEDLKQITSFEAANQKVYTAFKIRHFFDNNEELQTLKSVIADHSNMVEESDRVEYGDFQTNAELANKVVLLLASKNISPDVIVEPTCGKGNFIIAALQNFKHIKNIFGVEIYKPYVWETKFNLLQFFIKNPQHNKPEISIIHCNVFDFDFKQIAGKHAKDDILIIGNPPWVTNAKLGSLNSTNVPKKTNFKNHSGLDAITGKSNFDIAEFITLAMIDHFQLTKAYLLLLVKNSVIKNIVFDQSKNRYKVASIEKYCIDSKKEFNVSVEASLFYCQLNSLPAFNCEEFDFYDHKKSYITFGWLNDKFVSNIGAYLYTKEIDGKCPFVWRQGLKHDCSTVMELAKVNGHYINGLQEKVKLEEDLVYGLLKSSDLKNTVIDQTRKFTIVTQKKVGQETKNIKYNYPQTYQYLTTHQTHFDARKSNIYNNKPLFSIFGIGDYSFKLYKVAISGLYKTFHFTLILPQEEKPVMLDDTCYFIGFDQIEFAVYALILLNSALTKQFLQSITFADAKRTFTKDVLMRLDLVELAKLISKQDLQTELDRLNEMYKLHLTLALWPEFLQEMAPVYNGQIAMFE